jgi:hypothetical protein
MTHASPLRLRPFPSLVALFACAVLAAPAARAVTGVTPVTTPYLRADNALNFMRMDPKGRFLAYIGDDGLGLSVLDTRTRDIYRVSEQQVGASFFWSPDGYRLFYRELMGEETVSDEPPVLGQPRAKGVTHVRSVVRAYDCVLHRSVVVDDVPLPSGLLTFDPRDLRMHLLTPKGIRTRRIYFPDERLARWQVAHRNEDGKFLVTQAGVMWVTQGGFAMRKLDDDDTGVESFQISPDGTTIAWATKGIRVYTSRGGRPPVFIGYGRDPSWHPERLQLVYAGARMVGDVAASYDLRVADLKGGGKFLTTTQTSSERWPYWSPKGHQILYTIDHSTDVFVMDFKQ